MKRASPIAASRGDGDVVAADWRPDQSPGLGEARRAAPARWAAAALEAILPPIAAVALALLASAALLAVNGFPATDVVTVMIAGVFHDLRSTAEVLLKATPLIIIGVGLCIAFRCSIWNIGAEGQLYAGAIGATAVGVSFPGLPAGLHLGLILAVGALAGALWASIAGLLRVFFNASEIVTTIMLNYIAIILTDYLVTGPLRDPAASYPQSAKFARDVWLPRFLPPTRLHIGILSPCQHRRYFAL
jgi:simple sugar transport system permease protein